MAGELTQHAFVSIADLSALLLRLSYHQQSLPVLLRVVVERVLAARVVRDALR